MGISRHTAFMIQNHPDYKDGDGIEASASGQHENGKYAMWISFWRDRRPHISPLISSEPIYDTADQAKEAGVELIKSIREIDVS